MKCFASFEIDPPEKLEMLKCWRLIKDRGYPNLVAETEGMGLGYAYATNFLKYTLENSLYVSAKHLEMGIGFQLLERLVEE